MRSPAARALTNYVNAQVDQIKDGDSELRHAETPDTIHDTRVATRRLRSTLRVFGKVLDGDTGELDPAAELREPLDKRAKRTIKHYKQIQGPLGDHQDTVVATEALRQLALTAGTTVGENGFSYGMLYAREQQIGRRCREGALQLV